MKKKQSLEGIGIEKCPCDKCQANIPVSARFDIRISAEMEEIRRTLMTRNDYAPSCSEIGSFLNPYIRFGTPTIRTDGVHIYPVIVLSDFRKDLALVAG